MLQRQNGGRHQNRALFAVGDALKRGAQRHFGFAEAHVAAKQAVHRVRLFHIAFDFVNRPQLVGGFIIREAAFKVALHIDIRRKRIALHFLALGVQRNQLVGHIFDRLAHFGTRFFPFLAADAVEFNRSPGFVVRTDIFRDQVKLRNRHIQHVAARILDFNIILCDFADFEFLNAVENTDTVGGVDHIVAFFQLV